MDNIDKVYEYEDFIGKLLQLLMYIYTHDYDYYFLKHEFERAKEEEFNTLIVGNSYPLVGIDKNILKEKSFNLSMHSQDLYYSYKLAKECIVKNKSIKKCIIGVGYYLTYHDLSLGKSEYSKHMVKNIYMPILNDPHNSNLKEASDNIKIEDYILDNVLCNIFNFKNIQERVFEIYYSENPTYFNVNKTREDVSFFGHVKLNQIRYEEKLLIGKQRAENHNNLSKYSKTDKEFKKILNDFLNFLINNNVEPIIVAFPSTEYYMQHLDKNYSEKFYSIVNEMKKIYNIKLIDFNLYDDFNESDFIDIDHLGKEGCIKVTNYLNELIYM